MEGFSIEDKNHIVQYNNNQILTQLNATKLTFCNYLESHTHTLSYLHEQAMWIKRPQKKERRIEDNDRNEAKEDEKKVKFSVLWGNKSSI